MIRISHQQKFIDELFICGLEDDIKYQYSLNVLNQKTKTNHSHHFHILNVQIFRLLAKDRQKDEAKNYTKEYIQNEL